MSSRWLFFKMSPHSQFWISSSRSSCLVGVDVSCSGFMEAGSSRSLGLRPLANSKGVLPLEVNLCISHRCCLAHQLGRSNLCQSGLVQVLGGWIHECQENFLEQSYTHLSSVRPWCMRSLSEVSSHCAFGRMPACHEVGGRPYPHKSPSATHEA